MTKRAGFDFAWVSGDAKRLQTGGQPKWEAIVLGEKLQRKSEIAHYFSGGDSGTSANLIGLAMVSGRGGHGMASEVRCPLTSPYGTP